MHQYDQMMPVSLLFEKQCSHWGLRGDPFLWKEMEITLANTPLPRTTQALKNLIELEFKQSTGYDVTAGESIYLEKFAHGGMSSGEIAPSFWEKKAIPLLLRRFNALQNIPLNNAKVILSKINKLYKFLKKNHQYNKKLQLCTYKSWVQWQNDVFDKVITVLHGVANTQRQPKMDYLSIFFQDISNNKHCCNSFSDFVTKLHQKPVTASYKNLFLGLMQQPGWGPKTAALFTKSIYQMHNEGSARCLHFWHDVPSYIINGNDELYLPVDSVISEVFSKLGFIKTDFAHINDFLQAFFIAEEVDVIDDLWFWGFVTQKTIGKERIFGWNPNKYYSLIYTDKAPAKVKQIETLSEQFINIF